MSTRLYPLYQKGNPQLRIFLPNFWMKLVRPSHKQPKNVTQFLCSTEMTKHDIRNYLEKIYGVKCIDVRTRNVLGKFSKEPAAGYIKKEDDYKLAYVVLPKEDSFEYPDIIQKNVKEEEKRKDEKAIDESANNFKKFLARTEHQPGLPPWFSSY